MRGGNGGNTIVETSVSSWSLRCPKDGGRSSGCPKFYGFCNSKDNIVEDRSSGLLRDGSLNLLLQAHNKAK